ncbi:C-C chemokine receptor type 9-like [Callorhinchus milii]|uniref:Chemokine (C-C motif) receptor 9a n=1 Tax=Callorhinchus milii TaxID=7868 RepID=A0A4W3JMY9_CALMI|nr:C-C chemokine receptor type 9-like [Callorhinchus milii]|eukprot:gi/632965701/ref/XP_007899022.1/ PREDICTED: C-C chemokine receptor type 9-like [Callorhinchus milii]
MSTNVDVYSPYYFPTMANYDDSISSSVDYDYSSGLCDRSEVRQFSQYFQPAFYWCVCLLGAIGNILVVVLYAFYKRIKTMTDVYLLNLSIADLLFLCTLPFWALNASIGWRFGSSLCKIVSGVYKINLFSCMFLLTCISFDRYIAIVLATKAHYSKNKRLLQSKLVCLFVWIIATILSFPEFAFSSTNESQMTCSSNYPSKNMKVVAFALQVTFGFLLPLVIMMICYSLITWTLLQTKRFQKHKAIKVIVAVVSTFVLTQLPYNSFLIVKLLDADNITITDCNTLKNVDIATQITQSIAFLHCCLNPFLYAFIGVKFRQHLLKFLKDIGCFNQRQFLKLFKPQPGTSKRSSVVSESETFGTFVL